MIKRIESKGCLKGTVITPPDKSISHRAVMFASIAKGKSRIENLLLAADTISTLKAMEQLGAKIEGDGQKIAVAGFGALHENYEITGNGLHGLSEPVSFINCGNSGTTTRLLCGLLSGNPFFSVLSGDESLNSRPMKRVIKPLARMGAEIMARASDSYPPIAIRGGKLRGINYEMPVASAQVKSALILAALYADGESVIKEPYPSRDHTEWMLQSMGAELDNEIPTEIHVKGPSKELSPLDITVPGDFSSAAFFLVGALIKQNSDVLIKNVCLNPTRTGLLTALASMGAKIAQENKRVVSGEIVGDLHVEGVQKLEAATIDPARIPWMIDEIPILCIAAACAEGRMEIRGAGELRVKESDRITAMATGLKKMGVEVEEFEDGLAITGVAMKGARVDSFGDHRIAMSFAVAGLAASGVTEIENGDEAVKISYPGFFHTLDKLRGITGKGSNE
ncbi:MAG: 3-phosphoshikimate 1-carboxyvinyltransferase [Nitrospiraceae bacterium]|nr:3-phosphoshikimate 1-carboxyvinyltransferase [Nitrospiraceae bacterium]